MSPSKPVHPPISSEQSPPRSASACRRKRRCAPLLLLFLEKPLHGLFSDRVGLFAKSAPLCFRLSAKAPLRSLAPPLPRKAAARPFLGSRGSVRKVRPALLPPVGESKRTPRRGRPAVCLGLFAKFRPPAEARCGWYTVIIPRPAGEVYYNFVKFTSR